MRIINNVLAFALIMGVPAASIHGSIAEAKSKIDQSAGTKAAKSADLGISTKGDELAFDKATLNAKAGQPVRLTFENKASKSSNLQHNWVLTKPGAADSVASAGIAAGPDKGYVPDSPDVLAHTKLLNPGERDSIQFNAPSTPGDYPYICSFPGHAATMKGVLKVK